jgi:hypothetical protein
VELDTRFLTEAVVQGAPDQIGHGSHSERIGLGG